MDVTSYALETRALTKAYRGRRVVDALDLHVPKGAIYGLVGKNGAGKSTTMKMACGFVRPTSGEVRVFGCVAGPGTDVERETGCAMDALIEGPGILGGLTARENLMAKAIACGVVRAPERVERVLATVGLSDAAGRRCKGFSLGMKQRLGLALALLTSPDLLLLDEPFNGLDPEGTRQMRSLLVRLNRERGVTIVVSSHVLDQLDRMVTHFGVIREGRLVREMSSEQVREECSDCLVVRTADPAAALVALEERFSGLGLSVQPDRSIVVAPGVSADAVSRALHDADQVILELSVRSRDIEEYFVRLMEGDGPRA